MFDNRSGLYKKINKLGRIFFGFLIALVLEAVMVLVVVLLDRSSSQLICNVGVAVFVMIGVGMTVVVGMKQALEDDVHQLNLIFDHIHHPHCTKSRTPEFLERQTHSSVVSEGTGWTGAVIVDVVDLERMCCPECRSVTVWVPGEAPRLEVL